jgi:hypothetical protein
MKTDLPHKLLSSDSCLVSSARRVDPEDSGVARVAAKIAAKKGNRSLILLNLGGTSIGRDCQLASLFSKVAELEFI